MSVFQLNHKWGLTPLLRDLTLILLFCFATLLSLSGCSSILSSCSSIQRPKIYIPKCAPTPRPIKDVGVALVLGAGGSRGLAHLGVIEVLEKEGIPIDLIVGSSAGSLIGALYADCPNSEEVKQKVIRLKKKDLLDLSVGAIFQALIRLTGPIQGNALEKFVVERVQADWFEELKIPLIAVATNVDNNHITLLRSGPIAPAVHASSALPPFFSPVRLYNQILIDGGVIAPVPVQVAKLFKPKLIIAVDISTPPSRAKLSNALQLVMRSMHISFYELSRMQSTKADITIHPMLMGYGTFEDEYNIQLYEKGKEAAQDAIEVIKEELKRRGIERRVRCH
jgi:NTE family protein